jgi:hypothetical protein
VAGPVRALTARVELRDQAGTALGAVAAAQLVDPAFVARLAAVTGVAVTLLDGAPAGAAHTTEPTGVRDGVLAAAEHVEGDRVARTGGGVVRRVGRPRGSPPLILGPQRAAAPASRLAGRAVVLAGLLAVLAAAAGPITADAGRTRRSGGPGGRAT